MTLFPLSALCIHARYIAGGLSEAGQIWFSGDQGAHWTIASQITSDPAVRTIVTLTSFTYGCLGIFYSTAPAGSINPRQTNLVLYGGNANSGAVQSNPLSSPPTTYPPAPSPLTRLIFNPSPPRSSSWSNPSL